VVVLSAALTGSRGLVPLGLTAGLDTTAATQTADGKINGVDKPFGQFSTKLMDGQVPLTTAVPHSGIEGSKLALLSASRSTRTRWAATAASSSRAWCATSTASATRASAARRS
jgi:hypothetical protein